MWFTDFRPLMFPKHLDATDLHAKDRTSSRDWSECSSHTGSLKWFSPKTGARRELRSLPPVTSFLDWLHMHNRCFPKITSLCLPSEAAATHTGVIGRYSNNEILILICNTEKWESINTQLTGTHHTNRDSRWHAVLTGYKRPARVLMGRWKEQQGTLI